MNRRPPLAAVAVLSAAALAYEVLLLRLFAIIQWHHFAYLAISVALLGIGAAGTFVTLARRRLLALYPHSFSLAAAAFAVTAVVAGGTAVAQGLDKLIESCESCHGKDGYSTTADVPIIAGFSREGFVSTIEAFRKGERIAIEFHRPGEPETVMNEIAMALALVIINIFVIPVFAKVFAGFNAELPLVTRGLL